MKADVKNLENKVVGQITLNESIFNVDVRGDILSRVIHWQLAKRRAGTHMTKNVSMVQGTTKKPFKQKGTGNARQGSLRSAQMRGGGDAFGRQNRDYGYSLPKKIRALGLKIALSEKAKSDKLIIVDTLDCKSQKTKDLLQILEKLGITCGLFIDGEQSTSMFKNACANLHQINFMPSMGANVYDIIRHEYLVLSKNALETLEGRLS